MPSRTRQLKALETEVTRCRKALTDAQHGVCTSRKAERAAQKALERAQRRLAVFRQTEPTVSEHAILRYLERVEGVDTAAVRERLLPDKAVELIRQLGDGKYPGPDGCMLRVIDGVVVTVLTQEDA